MDTLEEVLLTVDDTELDQDDDLADVKAALEPVAAKWRDVGTMFRLKVGDLDTIMASHPGSPSACMFDVETHWLKKNYNVGRFGPPTWRKIVEAVGNSAGGGNPDHALKIAKEHKIGGASSQASATPKPKPPPAAADIIFQKRPVMGQIKLLKYKDGTIQRLRILEGFAVKWKDVGEFLGISGDYLQIIRAKYNDDPKKCAEEMVQRWLQAGSEVTWDVFLEALKDADLPHLAGDVQKALPTMIN